MAKQKSKPAAPDMVSLAELARRAGVTRQAVTSWVKQQEAHGIRLVQLSGRCGKIIDANDPLVTCYIKNVKNAACPHGKDAGEKSDNSLRKLQWRVEKIQLENEALRKKYLPTSCVIALLEQYLKLGDEAFKDFPERVLSRIERELNCTVTPESRREATKLIRDALASAHAANKRTVDDFKRKYAPEKTG